ncbi:MAG: Sec-independent protein translocase protein TatB [Acetobacteraceae bacterium]|nr:Sec-independent protein translocase protein TatB [Acetobacteraceae bacterium]
MFDIAWTEIGLIGIVALIVIGPKDLPVAIKAVTQMVKKARKMAGEFQTHVDEMVREADLHEVRDTFNDLRRMDIKGKILRAVDSDGTIGKSLAAPVTDFSPPPPPVPVADTTQDVAAEPAELPSPLPEVAIAAPVAPADPAPAFVPPRYAPQAERPAPVPPAFIPPAFAPAKVPQIEAA